MDNIKSNYHDPDSRYDEEEIKEVAPAHELDSLANQEKLGKLNDWWYECRIACSENRLEQAIDDDFVDGIQWFDEDVQILHERNQQPLVFNEVKPAVEWVIGTEKRTRIDWKVLPRTDEDRKIAEVKTKLLKYVTDVNKAEFARSRSFESAVKNGAGWIELGIRSDIDDEPLFIRSESWRNMWVDHLSVEPDISDARFVSRSKVMDLDVAIAMFPDRAQALKEHAASVNQLASQAEDDFYESQLYYNSTLANTPNIRVSDALNASQGRREVVRLIEMWYKEPTAVKIFNSYGSDAHGLVYDPESEEMAKELEYGHASLYDSIRMIIRTAIFIDGGILLQDRKSPYKHNRFPFVPTFGYRRGRDNQPYGIVRNARDPQMDLNKRRSKALFLLSVNRTIMDKGAVDDIDEYEEEVARPDAIIEKNQGKDLNIETNIQLAEEHLMMAQQDSEYIRNTSGVTSENLGHETNATSGKAITARQNQGTVVTATLFDNARLSVQLTGEIMLSLVEQFYGAEKVVRITGTRGIDEFLTINQYDENTGEYVNDITATQADFKVSEQDHKESLRIAMFEQMMAMIGQLDPEVALNLLDLVFEFSDLSGKDEIVKRIRKINGQVDPDDTEAEDKERIADEQRAAAEAEAQEMAKRTQEAEIRALEAKTERDESESDKSKMESLVTALEAALQALQAPKAAIAAQQLMKGVDMKPTGAETRKAVRTLNQMAKQPAIPQPAIQQPIINQ